MICWMACRTLCARLARGGPIRARLASSEGGNTKVVVAALLDNAELGVENVVRTGHVPGSDGSDSCGSLSSAAS